MGSSGRGRPFRVSRESRAAADLPMGKEQRREPQDQRQVLHPSAQGKACGGEEEEERDRRERKRVKGQEGEGER